MTRFSANLGFLWTDRPLPDAVRAAAAAGFDAVELHWPYDTPAAELRAALGETGLPVLGLNTRRGDAAAGENGLMALPGREAEARAALDEALDYAAGIGAGMVHAMAGNARGQEARACYEANLAHACDLAAARDVTVLIEPLNRHDAPGYFLRTTDQAAETLRAVGASDLKIMFDCYHVGRTEGDVITRARALRPLIGHVQIAGVPDRGPPDRGELDYAAILAALDWDAPVGAEYRPGGDTDATLGWMAGLRGSR